MHAGRVDEAVALAQKIHAAIIHQNTAQLRRVDTRPCMKDTWAKVRQLTGVHKNYSCYSATKFIVQDLKDHFAAMLSDEHYQKTSPKITAASRSCDISQLEVFRMLDRLQPTTTGPDLIPSWFLRLDAPVFSAPLAQLFNQSSPPTVVWYYASGRALSLLLSPKLCILPNLQTSDPFPSPLFYHGPLRDTLSERTSTPLCNNLIQTCHFQTSLLLDLLALPQLRSYHSCTPSAPG